MKWQATLYKDKHNFVYDYGTGLLELLAAKPGEHILDLGCGTGHLTKTIHEQCGSAVGMDSSAEMIESAKESFPEIEFYVRDATKFQCTTPFDAIFSNATLHWVHPPEKAIRCMRNNLVTGGRLVLELGGKGNIAAITHQLTTTLNDFGYTPKPIEAVWYFPSISEYTALLESNGFEVTLAQLFDRPTELASATSGILDWLTMFASDFFVGIAREQVTAIITTMQEKLKPQLFQNGKWYADYRRLRIIAKKI
ncbi:MAG: methyltransferase domain-containing protein [Bacteroidota bacterium]